MHPSRKVTIAYSFGSLAAGFYYAFNNFTLPLYLSIYTSNAILIGWLSSTRSFEQAIIQPFIGAWSDRTQTRLGRRAPFFLIAMPLSAAFFFVTGALPHDPALLWLVVVAVFIFSFLFNVGIDPYVALLADVVPSEHRGTVNGIASVFGFLGQVAVLIAAAFLWTIHPFWVFALVGVVLMIGFGLVALGVREPRELAHTPNAPARPDDHLLKPALQPYVQYVRDRLTNEREAMKLLGVRFLYQFGINAAVPFLTLFVVTQIGTTGWPELVSRVSFLSASGLGKMDAAGLSQLMAAILLLVTGVCAVPCGMLGDRFGKKRIFALGLFVTGGAALLAAFSASIPQLIVYLLILGFGNAAITILFFPYLSDLVPPERIGEFQGLSATAETSGVFLSAVMAGELINLNLFGLHYRLIFIITGIFLLLALGAVAFVKARLVEPHGVALSAQPAAQ
jgi:maltose/moltooligosaccharide transporter